MINICEIKSILKRFVKWDESINSNSDSMEPDDVLTDIATDAKNVLLNLNNVSSIEKHWLVWWEYANGVDENLNILWKPQWHRFYDSHLEGLAKPNALDKVAELKKKKNIRNISMKLCVETTIVIDENKDI